MGFKSLKFNIIINIAILLIIGMLITDYVITSFSKNDIIKAEFSKTDLIVFHLKNHLSKFNNNNKDEYIKAYLSDLIDKSNNYSIFFLNKLEHTFFMNQKIINNNKNEFNQQYIIRYAQKAIKKNEIVTHFFGETWGIFWKDKKYLLISYPIEKNMGISFIISLDHIYSSYREKQKVILFYIIFNTIFLCFIGLLRFSKIIISPIKKLTTLAEKYNGKNDTLYMLQSVDNEFGLLSNSLNSMMARISDDKQKLKDNFNELKKVQKEIIRAEKMSSIGKLSAGVAHEIGNPIGIVLGYLELLKQNNVSDTDKNDFLNRAETEIQRIDKIIKELLNLSRKSDIEYQPNSIHEIITETINMLKIQPSFSKIELKLQLNAANETVISDIDQLKQVFINLILNAVDAILLRQDQKGIIEIKTMDIKKPGPFIEIRISDNGPGISQKDLIKIFDPFYTTKEPGAGTGLGLWVSYLIIDELNGNIHADSDKNDGTTFIIMLPIQKTALYQPKK